MANKYDDIISYVETTPGNTNIQVLAMMLDNLIAESSSSEGGSTEGSPAIYYYPNMTIDEFEKSEYAQNIVPFSLIVVQDDKDSSIQELYYYYVYSLKYH